MSRCIFTALFSIGCFCAVAMGLQSSGDVALKTRTKPTISFSTSRDDRSCPWFKTIKADGTVELCT